MFVYPLGGGLAIERAMKSALVWVLFLIIDMGDLMPLIQKASDKAVRENTQREIEAGKDAAQAYAIAKSVQREARKKKLEGRYKEPVKTKK